MRPADNVRPPTDASGGAVEPPDGAASTVDAFDYALPAEAIAQEPLAQRDASRLLVLERATGRVEHRRFGDLLAYLAPGDVLVLNDTRVLPARLHARRATGGQVEFFVLDAGSPPPLSPPSSPLPPPPSTPRGRVLTALARPARRAHPGERYVLGPDAWLEVVDRDGETVHVRLSGDNLLERYGHVPLPPYIRRPLGDPERYQTVYAARPGAVAAPTAGLHFTPELLKAAADAGVVVVRVTLHVGLGTFAPVRVQRVADIRLHAEWCEVTPRAAEAINSARRVVAVGTTVARALESRAGADGRVAPGSGWTALFISPGYRFRRVDALLTNFHLPRSTLLMLVAAFAGREPVLAAYREAVALRYRFFSFGDAMLIV